jgi:ribonuclease R
MNKSLPERNRVVDLLARENKPLHAREIASKLDVGDNLYQGLLRLLDDLSQNGAVSPRGGDRYSVSKTNNFSSSGAGEERTGTMSIAAKGFGFVASQGSSGDDVFIPPESLGGAMQGDTVVITVRSRSARGPEGAVVKITNRAIKRVAGTLRRRGKSAWLEPDDNRIRGPIVLESEIDKVASEGNSGNDGDAAVVSIIKYPIFPDENPVGKLEAVLGRPGELKVEVAKVLVREGIEEVHSSEAFNEAEAFGPTVPESMLVGREDLTHLPLPTIDPEDARDHDDAVWVERTENGGYKAWIAIADVSSYVTPGTKIDDEALKRGCSVYLPDRAIPMLPRPLSSNLCSLLPDVVRLCLCVEAEIDSAGLLRNSRLIRGFMKSRAKLTYGGVARALGFSENPPREPKADEMVEGLKVANELSRLLRGRRMARGAVDFNLPEAKIVLGEDGLPVKIERRAQDAGVKKAYELIEELMLLANETVAAWEVNKIIATIFRVHAPPDQAKIVKFATLCERLGIQFDDEATTDPKKLSELLKSFADHPLAPVLNSLLLRSMKQATYDVTNIGHFGLASKAYLHFTSPIRRYPDLVVHRGVHAEILGKPKVKDVEKLAEAALMSSQSERKSMEVEREVADLYRTIFMKDKIGNKYEGTVTALVGSGAFVALDDPYVDVMVKFEDMGDQYELDDDALRAVAVRSGDSINLGDRMTVEILDAAILRRTVYAKKFGTTKKASDFKNGRFPAKNEKISRDASGRNGATKFGSRDPRGAKAARAQAGKSEKRGVVVKEVPSTVRRKAKGDKRVTEGESRNKGGGGKFGGKKFGKNKKKKR